MPKFWQSEYTKINTCKFCKKKIQWDSIDGFWDHKLRYGYSLICDSEYTYHLPDYSFKKYAIQFKEKQKRVRVRSRTKVNT